ncbi:MAG: putative Ig domain-containing protein, partial [Acidimicrobiales bacterium]
TLPAGLTFTDQHNGTALLSGTPTATGTTTLDITAANTIAPNATQSLSVVVGQAPTITSAATATTTVGTASSFTVTTTGYPAPSLGETGTLPSGVTFVNNGNGTATLAGTPAAATGGVYPITITAVNGTGTTTQSFSLTVDQAPAMTSAASASFNENTAGTFTVTTTGYPAAVLSETGTLPTGVTFTAGAGGTATLSGTPAFLTAGSYPITLVATNAASTTDQAFTLTVNSSPPVFTSAASATFSENNAGAFSVAAKGDTPITYTETGALPSGVTLASNGSLSGIPAFLTAGTYPITVTATDVHHATTTQSFTLKVATSPPVFTSAATTTFSENNAGSFSVTAKGDTPIAYTEKGALPSGVTLAGNGTLSGTPAFLTAGTYPITVTATDVNHATTTQSFTLKVTTSPPVFTSAATSTFSENNAGTFSVTAKGDTPIAFTETGALPSGVTLAGNGTLSGTPAFHTAGTYPITVTVVDSDGATTTQDFTLTVTASPPVFTSAASATFGENTAGTFSVAATGDSPIAYTEKGVLPPGVTLADGVTLAADGTLSGTPAFGTAGTYPITITATDANHATTTQTFALTVTASPPVFTSAVSATLSENHAGTFRMAARGDKPIAYTEAGALPAGVTLDSDGTLSGTPQFGTAGTYPITVTGTDFHHATTTQVFTVDVSASPPVFTSAASTTFIATHAGTFSVVARGDRPIAYTETGALPSGVTLDSDGTLSGTPALGADGSYPITVTGTDIHGQKVTQRLDLIVDQAPAITSPDSASSTVGTSFSFTVTTSGYPARSLGETGALPAGISFVAANGSATLTGTPAAGTAGTYPITLTSSNGTSPDATQTFTLTVLGVPALTGGGHLAATPDGLGYWIVGPTGSIAPYGSAGNYGSMAGTPLNDPIVGIASTPDGKGYWMVASDGGVFSFGDAQFYGSTGSITLNKPIVGIATTPDGKGYWMVASDGGVFAFGDAGFYGSTGSITLNKPVVGMASSPDGKGYWMVASDGGIFAFGDAGFYGSAGGIQLNQPIMGMTATRNGQGYWLVAADGGIFTYGDAGFYGSGGGSGAPAVGIIASPTGPGYALIDADGTRTDFGF